LEDSNLVYDAQNIEAVQAAHAALSLFSLYLREKQQGTKSLPGGFKWESFPDESFKCK
jgi:hypothetical protein